MERGIVGPVTQRLQARIPQFQQKTAPAKSVDVKSADTAGIGPAIAELAPPENRCTAASEQPSPAAGKPPLMPHIVGMDHEQSTGPDQSECFAEKQPPVGPAPDHPQSAVEADSRAQRLVGNSPHRGQWQLEQKRVASRSRTLRARSRSFRTRIAAESVDPVPRCLEHWQGEIHSQNLPAVPAKAGKSPAGAAAEIRHAADRIRSSARFRIEGSQLTADDCEVIRSERIVRGLPVMDSGNRRFAHVRFVAGFDTRRSQRIGWGQIRTQNQPLRGMVWNPGHPGKAPGRSVAVFSRAAKRPPEENSAPC